MKLDFRQVFVRMHAHLQMEEDAQKRKTSAEAATREKSAREHRLLLENLIQQALTNEFLDQSAAVQGTDGPSLMKDLLRGPYRPEDDQHS